GMDEGLAGRIRWDPERSRRWKVFAALAGLSFIWGSTYLAIRIAIESLPPFLMAGVRFLIAGGLLYGWARARGADRPGAGLWGRAAVSGALLLACGNGAVVWAEQFVPSGMVSLLVATVPLWIVLQDWGWGGGGRPGVGVMFGIFWGLVGSILTGTVMPGCCPSGHRFGDRPGRPP
ncbi:MAG: EamA family transporter, partial [Longimicrobiales bacterium]